MVDSSVNSSNPTFDDLARAIATHHQLAADLVTSHGSGLANHAFFIGPKVLRINVGAISTVNADARQLILELIKEARLPRILLNFGIPVANCVGFGAVAVSGSVTDLLSLEESSKSATEELLNFIRATPGPVYCFSLFQRLPGEVPGLLDYSSFTQAKRTAFFSQLGRIYARLHTPEITELVSDLVPTREIEYDWRQSLNNNLQRGTLSTTECEEIEEWLNSAPPDSSQVTLVHHDAHPWNCLVDAQNLSINGVIDWADSCLADPAYDFASMPAAAIEPMLHGYAEAGKSSQVTSEFKRKCFAITLKRGLWELTGLNAEVWNRAWWRMPPGGWALDRDQFRK